MRIVNLVWRVSLAAFLLTVVSACTISEDRIQESDAQNGEALGPTIVAIDGTPTSSGTPILTATQSVPSQTPQPSLTPQILPSPSDVHITPVPSETLAYTPAPTMTPLPTLPAPEAEATVRELLLSNRSCRLPCWWGAIPGETEWSDVEHFIAPFASNITEYGNPLESRTYYDVSFYYPDLTDPTLSLGLTYTVDEGTVAEIGANLPGVKSLRLSQLLASYGRPHDIQISAYSNTPDGTLPMRLVLVFPDDNFMASYWTMNAVNDGGEVTGCFSEVDTILLWLFPDRSEITLEGVRAGSTIIGEDQKYLPLAEATELSIDEFFQEFKNTESDTCIRTPSDLWPY